MDQNRMLPSPSKQQILSVFAKHNFTPKSFITKPKLQLLLNAEHKRIFAADMDQQLLQEIWEQSQSNSRGEIVVDTVVDIILEAQGILKDRIMRLSDPDGMIVQTQQEIDQKRGELADYKQYYSDQPFKINQLTKQLIALELQQKQQKHEFQNFSSEHYSLCKIFSPQVEAYSTFRKQATVYNSKTEKPQKKSKQFLFVFHLTWLLLIIEMLIMNIRVSFLVIAVYLWSLYIIFFADGKPLIVDSQQPNSEPQKTQSPTAIIGYWMLLTVISIIGDIIFIVLKYANKSVIMPILHTDNNIYYQILIIITIFTIIIRVVMLLLYYRIRSKCQEFRQYFQIFGSRFYLFEIDNGHKDKAYETQHLSS